MKILLDTSILIPYIMGDEKRIRRKLQEEIIENQRDNYISVVSLWEIATKVAIGKLELEGDYIKNIENSDFRLLGLEPDHIRCYQTLPLHHRDPFDRMIIAQAISENMRIATSDEDFTKYSVKLLNN